MGKPEETGKAKKKAKKEKQWWNKPDHELIKDRIDHLKDVYDDAKIEIDEEERPSLYEEMKDNDTRVLNLLDMVLKRRKGLEKEGEFLLVPVYDTDKGEKLASLLKMKTTRRIKLDDYGWAVWDRINGKRDIREIGTYLRERFGDNVEPLYPRLSKFIAYLNHLDLVKIEKKK